MENFKKPKKKKVNISSALYVVLAIFVCVLSVFSFTFAWYIKSSTETINITFATPIVVNIKSGIQMLETSIGTPDAVMPGDRLQVNIGVQMADVSSTAYVRARLMVEFEDVFDENNQPVSWEGMVDGFTEGMVDHSIMSDDWVRVNFSRGIEPDYWYVLRLRGASNVSRELSPGEVVTFLNGQIGISLDLDNRFAEKKISFNFTVDTLQVQGVEDPLAQGISRACEHGQWGHP